MSDLKPPIENVPQCLRDVPQWVCWRYVERHGKRTKVPIDARTGRNASAVEASTWAPFEMAHEAFLRADSLAAAAHNLGVLTRTLFGIGTPRSLQQFRLDLVAALSLAQITYLSIWRHCSTLWGRLAARQERQRCWSLAWSAPFAS